MDCQALCSAVMGRRKGAVHARCCGFTAKTAAWPRRKQASGSGRRRPPMTLLTETEFNEIENFARHLNFMTFHFLVICNTKEETLIHLTADIVTDLCGSW